MRPKYRGFLSLLGTSFIYGSFGVIVRALGPYFTENQMTFLRSFVVFAIIFTVLFIKKISITHIPKKLLIPLFVHSTTFAATIFLFTYAVTMTSLGKATFSFYATTLLSSLIASIVFFKEGFSTKKAISLSLAVIGLIFFILPQGIGSIGLGMTLTGIAGIGDVITNSMKKYLGGKVEKLVLVLYQMLAGLIVGLILIISSNQYTTLQPLDLVSIAWLLFFSLNFFLLSYLTVYGFQHFDLNLGTIILSLELVWATLIGYFWFNETLNPFQITAMVLVTLSIIVMNISWKENKNDNLL